MATPTHPILKFAFNNVTRIESVDRVSFNAKCNFCKFPGVNVKFDEKSYSNLVRHLKRKHLKEYRMYLDQIKTNPLDGRGESMMKSYFKPLHTSDTTQFISSHHTTEDIPSVPCNTNISEISAEQLPLNIVSTNEDHSNPPASASNLLVPEQPTEPSHLSTEMKRKIQPVFMCKVPCSACICLGGAEQFYKNSLKVALAGCTHKNGDCCCRRKFEELRARVEDEKPGVSEENSKTFDGSTFLCQYNSDQEKIVHFCKVCLRHGRPSKGKRKMGESWIDGITFDNTRNKNRAMKAHLQSQQHKESLEYCKAEDENQIKLGLPTKEERENATKNTMIAGIFMTSNSLPFRLYTSLCALLSLISPSHLSNPLGNVHQTHSGIRNVLLANYKACAVTMKQYFNSTFAATKSRRKFTISCDKGTAPKDASRQAIVATYVSDCGMPKEMVLGVPIIRQGDATATTNHMKENVALFLDPSSVAFVCTDGAAVYTG